MRRNLLTGTIRTVIPLSIMFALMLLSYASVSYSLVKADDSTSVSVVAPEKVNQGETFIVTIAVTPGASIAGMQLDLSFDSSLITAVQVEEGDLLSQDGASTYFSPGIIGTSTISGVSGVIITPGQTVSTAGTFASITFTANTAGGSCNLNLSSVIVGDIDGQSLPVTTVNGQVGINIPPVLNPIGDKTTNEGALLEFIISATDADDVDLEYSAMNLPAGATFDAETGTFSWTPNYAQADTYTNITFQVTDDYLTSEETITIVVEQPYSDWDINGDSSTNVLDMIRIGQHWGEMGVAGWISEDANEDGSISVLDMILVGQHWTG